MRWMYHQRENAFVLLTGNQIQVLLTPYHSTRGTYDLTTTPRFTYSGGVFLFNHFWIIRGFHGKDGMGKKEIGLCP